MFVPRDACIFATLACPFFVALRIRPGSFRSHLIGDDLLRQDIVSFDSTAVKLPHAVGRSLAAHSEVRRECPLPEVSDLRGGVGALSRRDFGRVAAQLEAMRIGSFCEDRKAELYPVDELDAWVEESGDMLAVEVLSSWLRSVTSGGLHESVEGHIV